MTLGSAETALAFLSILAVVSAFANLTIQDEGATNAREKKGDEWNVKES